MIERGVDFVVQN